jgi:carboxyl-terminal processing protease
MSKRELVWIAAVGLLLYLWVGPATAKRDALYPDYETMSTIVDRVLDSYVDKVDPQKLFYGAYDGMMATLDPYSNFLPPQGKEDLDINTVGEFGGLGIEITTDERKVLMVETPLEGTPAFYAGVRPGDRIVEIEGKTARPDPTKTRIEILNDAVKRLRGPKGTKVRIRVFHADTRTYEDFTIVRDIIKVKSIVSAKMVDEKAGIGYIRMSQFQQHTAQELDETVKGLRQKGMKAMVLDLRFNPGGLLDSAVEVADRFIREGVIVSTKGRAPDSDRVFKATGGPTYPDFPLAVLITGRSASASEILAGAVKDHHRGIIVGTRSFGKASVQTVIPLEGNKSAIKLTTAKYYTPSGKLIHRGPESKEEDQWGIQPDLKVEMSFEEVLQLVELWRKEHVVQTPPKEGEKPAPPNEAKQPNRDDMMDLLGPAAEPEEAPTEEGITKKPKAEKKPFVDRQLEAAVSALQGAILEHDRLAK